MGKMKAHKQFRGRAERHVDGRIILKWIFEQAWDL